MIIDVIAAAFVVLFSFYMMKKGGVKAVLSLVSMVLAIIVAFSIYPVVSEYVYDTPLFDIIKDNVGETIAANGGDAFFDAVDAMPDFMQKIMGIEPEAQEGTMEGISANVAVVAVNIITFVIVLIATKLLLALVSWVLNLVTKLPALKQINALAGFLCGVAVSVAVLWVAVQLMGVISTSNAQLAQAMSESYTVDIMSGISPF